MTQQQQRRRVLLAVPKLVRDLDGHALVAYFLERHFGDEVILHTGPETEKAFFECKPDALVLDWLGWEDRVRQARLARAAGVKLCVLPTAGVFPDESGFLKGAGYYTGACDLVDCYLSWGEYAANAILSKGIMPRSRVEIVGCPRFDFYHNRKLAHVDDRSSFLNKIGISQLDKPIILWCTSTNNYNNLSRNPGAYVASMTTSGAGSTAHLQLEIEDEKEQLHVHSKLVLELAKRHTNWNFVIKVHPLEHRRFYTDRARPLGNVFIAPNVPIGEFLFHSDVLLQRGCTTATEAWAFNKPVLELRMGNFKLTWATPEHTRGNHSVFTLEEAEHAIAAYLNGAEISAEQADARTSYFRRFYYRSDSLSSFRCARRIHQEVSGPGYTDEDQRRTRASIDRLRLCAERERDCGPFSRLKHLLGTDQHRTLRPWKRSFWSKGPIVDKRVLAGLYRHYEGAVMDAAEALTKLGPADCQHGS